MNNTRLEVKKIIEALRKNYEAAGTVQLRQIESALEKLREKQDSWTEDDKKEYEDTATTGFALQASLQGAFSFADTLLTKLGFLDEESTLDKNEKNLQGISGDNGIIKYTLSNSNNN
jgi:hypothetical protein